MNKKAIKLLFESVQFIAGAAKINQLPNKGFIPEIAFFGKSNVGKSSLINAICNRHCIARVSGIPGCTQQINFFALQEKLILVDVPGYGFAKTPPTIRQNWEKLITYYLENRDNLKTVYLLIDARRGIKDNDIDAIQLLLSYDRTFKIVFTKADKISLSIKNELINTTKQLLQAIACLEHHEPIFTSVKDKSGIDQLRFSAL